MRLTQSEIKRLNPQWRAQIEKYFTGNQNLHSAKKHKRKNGLSSNFESLAEEKFFYYLQSLNGITSIETYKEFSLLHSIDNAVISIGANTKINFSPRIYTTDFFITLNSGKALVIELKGSVIKKLQRDFSLRFHIFAEKYLIPNEWKYCIIKSEYVTNIRYWDKYELTKNEIEAFINANMHESVK